MCLHLKASPISLFTVILHIQCRSGGEIKLPAAENDQLSLRSLEGSYQRMMSSGSQSGSILSHPSALDVFDGMLCLHGNHDYRFPQFAVGATNKTALTLVYIMTCGRNSS